MSYTDVAVVYNAAMNLYESPKPELKRRIIRPPWWERNLGWILLAIAVAVGTYLTNFRN